MYKDVNTTKYTKSQLGLAHTQTDSIVSLENLLNTFGLAYHAWIHYNVIIGNCLVKDVFSNRGIIKRHRNL